MIGWLIDASAKNRALVLFAAIALAVAGVTAMRNIKLDAIPERGGTMLDNTVVVWFNELGSGGTHTHENTPWVIAGNTRGLFKTGQLVSFPNEPHNRLLMTLSHAMGVEETAFGDPDFCKGGPLTGVTT